MEFAHLSLAVGMGDNSIQDILDSDSFRAHDVAFEAVAAAVAERGSAAEAASVVSAVLAVANSTSAVDDDAGETATELCRY